MLLNKYNLNLIERGINMGFTLNQLEQERQIRKLQKKEDKDTKDYEQLSNLPKINNVELKGDKTTSDLGINATNVMMSDGVVNVEEALDKLNNLPANYSNRTDVYTYNTPQNCYICPSDGYVEFKGDASTVASLNNYFGNDNGYCLLQTNELRVGIFVRKGFKFWLENATQGVFVSLV